MVQLSILSCESAGTLIVARRFPFAIGRGAESQLQLEAPGIWEKHLTLTFDPSQGIVAEVQGEAMAAIGDEPFRRQALRNGDVIEIGSLKLRFSLSATVQRSFLLREWLTWLALGGLVGGQGWLIWWLRDAF